MPSTKNSPTPKSQSPNFRKNFIWNLIGSTASAFTSLFFMMIVTRINGIDDAGIFSFAFSMASMFWIIGVYSGRTFQITDTNKKTTDSDYFYAKFATCLAMLIFAIIFCITRGYDLEKITIIMFLVVFRALEAFSESCYAVIQKKDRLYQVGRSLFFKALFSLGSFLMIDLLTGNLVFSCIMIAFAHMLIIAFYDLPRVACTGFKMQKIVPEKVWLILKIGFFAFGFTILGQYLNNAARIAIDSVGTNEEQTFYGILAMPAAMLSLCAQYFIQPFLTAMKRHLNQNITTFIRLVTKICLAVLGLGAICLGAAWLLGIPILELLYAVKLDNQVGALLVIILCGICLGIVAILSAALTTMRQTGGQLVCYLIASVFAFFISKPLVAWQGVLGACLVYLFSIIVVLVLYIGLFVFETKKFKNNFSEEVARVSHE